MPDRPRNIKRKTYPIGKQNNTLIDLYGLPSNRLEQISMKNIRTLIFIAVALAIGSFLFPLGVQAQNWKVWSTIPAFDSGRTMPLSSFAQQIVKDVCGSPNPLIVPDDSIIAELNRVVEAQPQPETPDLLASHERPASFLPRQHDDAIDSLNTGFGSVTDQMRQNREQIDLKIKNLNRNQAERIIQRINTLAPAEGRRFDAAELLLSWLAEPEVWDYIPIFAAPESDYRNEVLGVPARNNNRYRLKRVAVFQLEQSAKYQQRLQDIQQRRQQGDGRPEAIRFNEITVRIARSLSAFQELTFDPRRHYPDRMVAILDRAGDVSGHRESSYAIGFGAWNYLMSLGDDPTKTSTVPSGDSQQPVHPTTERWRAIARKMMQLAGAFDHQDDQGVRRIPNLDAVEKQFELLINLIETNLDEAVALMKQIYPEVQFVAPSNRPNAQYTEAISAEAVLPNLFSHENMERNKESVTQLVLTYHYALKTLRREVEAAYISLYDNGRTLRVLPLCTELAVSSPDDALGVQPWASMQFILRGRDASIRRFLDPDYPKSQPDASVRVAPTPKREEKTPEIIPGILSSALTDALVEDKNSVIKKEDETEKNASDADSAEKPETSTSTETVANEQQNDTERKPADARYEIELFGEEEPAYDILTAASVHSTGQLDQIRRIRRDFYFLYKVYATPGLESIQREFDDKGNNLQHSLRNAALQPQDLQNQFAVDPNDPGIQETWKKIAYPTSVGILNTEYRYFRLSPFFWMWLFAAAAIVFVLISLFIGVFRRDMVDISSVAKKEKDKENDVGTTSSIIPNRSESDVQNRSSWQEEMYRPDFTNSPEEHTLWLGFTMLGLSVFVTLIGGAMRAWITGWAPITNMYETVVFLAFSASILGLWYSLYPLLHPALELAWRYSSFPALKSLSALWARLSRQPASATENGEFPGQYSMKQAAEDFGIPDEFSASGIYRGYSGIYGGARSGILSGVRANADHLVDSLSDPYAEQQKKQATRTIFWQSILTVPRLILMFLTFIAVIYLSYGESAGEHGVFAAAGQMLAMHDPIDWLVVVSCIALIVWFVPHLILAGVLFFFVLFKPSQVAAALGIISFKNPKDDADAPKKPTGRSEMSSVFQGETLLNNELQENSGELWINLARNRVLKRKLFVLAAAFVALAAGLAAYFNTTEFNPNIRPLMAVLRSNFWLTVHVIAIIISYAAALVAWGMAVVALGGAIFGRYRYVETSSGRRVVHLPAFCDPFALNILKLLRTALLLLALGTVLGARWADYSWGRFWSWDSKEVWALITILFLAVVLHSRLARYFGQVGVMVGALFGSFAIIMTWYGINFVFEGSRHAYGGDATTGAKYFLLAFISLNLLWGFFALFRYGTIVSIVRESDNRAEETTASSTASS